MRAPLLLLSGLASCLQVSWGQESRYEPIPDEAIGRLEEHAIELGECLEIFGAPLWVWEYVEGGRDGAVLAYGWIDGRQLGFNVSVPVTEQTSASFDFDALDRRMRGLVLFFDHDWKLTTWRTGLLVDLTQGLRRRPALIEDEREGA